MRLFGNRIREAWGMIQILRGKQVSGTPEFYGSVELLQELMDASAPYLRRKKMTPRHQCNELNRVWAKCSDYLEKQNATNETR